MTDPTPIPQPATPARDMTMTVALSLNPALHRHHGHVTEHQIGANALEQLADGDRSAALGAALAVLLDMTAAGQPGPAATALAIALELAHRIVAARDELGLQA